MRVHWSRQKVVLCSIEGNLVYFTSNFDFELWAVARGIGKEFILYRLQYSKTLFLFGGALNFLFGRVMVLTTGNEVVKMTNKGDLC